MEDNLYQAALQRLLGAADSKGLAVAHEPGADGRSTLTAGSTQVASLRSPQVLELACPAEQKTLLMEISPTIYFEEPDLVGAPTVLVRLDRIEDEELALRLADAAVHASAKEGQKGE
jgi:hypothetical protein